MADLADLLRRPGPGNHTTSLSDGGREIRTLADLPPMRDHLLFVGLSPSPESVEEGHYQQGKLGRTFWRRLMLATLLPAGTAIEDADDALAAAGHGITDLSKAPSVGDEPSDAELRSGVGPLWQKVAIWRPAAVVFIDKRAAVACAGRPLAESWGQVEGVALAGRPCFLMPGAYASTEEVDEGLNFLRNLSAALPHDRA